MSAQPSTPPGTGVLLDSRYRVEELISRGGMASVHRGHDERLDRTVALKIMHPHLAVDEQFRRRFAREARSVARLAHRHVVGVFDQGEDGERIYLAMELVDGPTLRTRITRAGQLTVRQALEVTESVLEALATAHAAGIVHRDIKPENILIAADGTVKVADFGLARLIGAANSSATGTLLGTVAYVSPEIVTRGLSDERSDLYSLGVVLYEMLVGTQPYIGDLPVHIAFQHVHEDLPAPSLRAPNVPRSVDSLVTWCCARTATSRPASAEEVLRSVRDLLAATPGPLLDAAPLRADDSSTHDVPRPTTELAAAPLTLHEQPRTFPERLPDARPDADEGDVADAAARDVNLPLPRTTRGRHRRGRGRRASPVVRSAAAASVLALLAAGGWIGGDWYLTTGPGADRTVPGVAGSALDDAEAALSAQDLSTRTLAEFSETVPEGHVVSASPAPGSVVKRDSPVVVVVSQGEQTFPVPDVEGLGVAEARNQVEEAELTLVEDDPVFSETVPEGQIVSQSTQADALPAGSPVTVVVSQGREPIEVTDQAGRGVDGARAALEDSGFEVSTSQAYSGTVPAGAVVSQSPASGTLYRGDPVELVVSRGPEMLTVPDVFRMTEQDARAELESAGFAVEVAYENDSPVFDLVHQQSAEAGSELERGSTVTITVF